MGLKVLGFVNTQNVIRNYCSMLKGVDSVELIDKYLPYWDFTKSNQIQLNNKDIPDIPDISIR
jgi:hypothetical protein